MALEEAGRVGAVYRIAADICVKVLRRGDEPERLLGEPASRVWIIVSRSEPYQPGISIVETTGKSHRLEGRSSVSRDLTELVVVEALGDGSACGINDQSR